MDKKYSSEERDKLVAAWRASGLTQRTFAAANGLNLHTLKYWLYDESLKARRTAAKEVSTSANSPFVRVAVAAAVSRVRLEVNGLILELDNLPPAHYVAELARLIAC